MIIKTVIEHETSARSSLPVHTKVVVLVILPVRPSAGRTLHSAARKYPFRRSRAGPPGRRSPSLPNEPAVRPGDDGPTRARPGLRRQAVMDAAAQASEALRLTRPAEPGPDFKTLLLKNHAATATPILGQMVGTVVTSVYSGCNVFPCPAPAHVEAIDAA